MTTLYDLKAERGHKMRRLEKMINFKALAKIRCVILADTICLLNLRYNGYAAISCRWCHFVGNIYTILMESYLLFPCITEGYYSNKYAEEYRDWEGKTKIEWYGEKYFDKHIEGTEKN